MEVTFLLGSGFSKPMGLPLAKEVNERFNSSILGKLLQHSSGEWQWVQDNDSASINNGKLSQRVAPFEFLFEVFVKEFTSSHSEGFNYEEFYQWVVIQSHNRSALDKIHQQAEILIKESDYSLDFQKRIIEELKIYPIGEVYSCLNHLIADMLPVRSKDNLLVYDQFLQIIKNHAPISIFTLNHDLLVEYLLKSSQISYSNGFSSTNSCIVGDSGNPLNIFQGDFSESVRLIKLHGSIDTYRFEHMVEVHENQPLPPAWMSYGDCEYFKAGYRDKHYVKKIDIKTGNVVQPYNANIAPQLLTGVNKDEIIQKDKMYSRLFEYFQLQMKQTEVLCVIGFSYGDNHIKSEVLNAINGGKLKKIINIDPNFPEFLKDVSTPILNLSDLSQLKESDVL